MVGISLLDFFPAGAAPPPIAPLLAQASPLSSQPRHLFLYGPEQSGKTSLLFHLAYSLASKGASVLIITSRERLEYNPPALAQGLSPNDPVWLNIQIKYIEDETSLLQFASLLHLARPAPTVLLIDDIDRLPASVGGAPKTGESDGKFRSRDVMLCRVLAVLCNSLEHVSQSQGRPTLFVTTASLSSSSDTPRSFHLYQRWLPVALRCWALGPQGSNNGKFRMTQMASSTIDGCNIGGHGGGMSSNIDDGPVPTGFAVDYSIAQGLCVENVQAHP
ncbi:hypothetical protein Ndes2526B_g03104 [Nannochloris sp. 'desiccata']